MATTADATSNNLSPRSSGFSGDIFNTPQLRRRNLSSPWAHVVRGDSEAVTASPSSPSSPMIATQEQIPDSDCTTVKVSSSENSVADSPSENDAGMSNVARAKRQAWNKLSNGAVELGPVMGAVSWPALSESTKALPKSSTDSLKGLSDGSVSIPQKSMKRGGGGGGSANGNFSQPPPPPPAPAMEMPQNNKSGKPPQVVLESAPRDPSHKSNNWETGQRGGFVSQSHIGNDHPQQRNSFRRGNGGSHPRSDGTHHNNYGSRRDQDRGNHEWNSHRGFNGRDVHMQQQRMVPRGFIRPPPPNSTPFIGPPPVRPFGNPMGFPDVTSPVYYVPAPPPEPFRGVPFIHHTPPPMFFPTLDPQLCAMLVRQIDYYFSPENLCKDIFLRQNMDEQGWVPVSLISSFNRVKQLTNNIPFILEAVRSSTVVEVQGDKIRRRNEWMNWPLPPYGQFVTSPGPQSPTVPSYNLLASRVQSIGLDEVHEEKSTKDISKRNSTDSHSEAILSRSSSGDLNSPSQESGGEVIGDVTGQVVSDPSMLARSSIESQSC
ncbi:PREDICTED: la-related protein 1C-like isoform X2 [Nelumbo nucifera]|uniref:HTH La-type RNA-binding domain-containing protein n=2 Tax=Nelumbo nucifera TaxID=4432 RepID=A0A822Z9Y6_NELNU|nr:PREDICTED: la-related protein 1C-like isoform X2 [Nelumbo nucifera]DAD41687.1 TPA_asm: hypothetical protein HUJ06_016010 [Nelumbo nucifera]